LVLLLSQNILNCRTRTKCSPAQERWRVYLTGGDPQTQLKLIYICSHLANPLQLYLPVGQTLLYQSTTTHTLPLMQNSLLCHNYLHSLNQYHVGDANRARDGSLYPTLPTSRLPHESLTSIPGPLVGFKSGSASTVPLKFR